jgi:hypothetical protein
MMILAAVTILAAAPYQHKVQPGKTEIYGSWKVVQQQGGWQSKYYFFSRDKLISLKISSSVPGLLASFFPQAGTDYRYSGAQGIGHLEGEPLGTGRVLQITDNGVR